MQLRRPFVQAVDCRYSKYAKQKFTVDKILTNLSCAAISKHVAVQFVAAAISKHVAVKFVAAAISKHVAVKFVAAAIPSSRAVFYIAH